MGDLGRAQRALLEHFDKAIAAVGIAALVAVGVGASQPPELKETGKLAERADEVRRCLVQPLPAARGPLLPPLPDRAAALARDLDPSSVPEVQELPGWMAHRRPSLVTTFPPPCPPPSMDHAPAVLGAPEARRGAVQVRWTPATTTTSALVRLERQELWRQVGDGPWELVATLGPEAGEHLDRAPGAGELRYRVRSYAALGDDPRLERAKIRALPKELAERESAPSAAARALPLWALRVNTVTVHDPVTQPGGVDRAYLYVLRWDEAKGSFQRRGFLVTVGEAIGEGDFACGAKLVAVELASRPHPSQARVQRVQQATIVWPDGRQVVVSDRDTP
ncbi:MAG: hypothetical protein AB7N76_22570 [Planctomycetota bacterium]